LGSRSPKSAAFTAAALLMTAVFCTSGNVVVSTDLRLKFMTVLMLIVLAVSVTITVMRFGLSPLWADHFVPELSAHYQTSAMFAAFYGLLNFYVFTMGFVYSPSRNAVFGQLPLMAVVTIVTFVSMSLVLFSVLTASLHSRC